MLSARVPGPLAGPCALSPGRGRPRFTAGARTQTRGGRPARPRGTSRCTRQPQTAGGLGATCARWCLRGRAAQWREHRARPDPPGPSHGRRVRTPTSARELDLVEPISPSLRGVSADQTGLPGGWHGTVRTEHRAQESVKPLSAKAKRGVRALLLFLRLQLKNYELWENLNF